MKYKKIFLSRKCKKLFNIKLESFIFRKCKTISRVDFFYVFKLGLKSFISQNVRSFNIRIAI